MANPKQPINLVIHKGASHRTKAEIADRLATEVKAPYGNVQMPAYLNRKQREEFEYLSTELAQIGIFADIDAGLLARYCVAHWQYGQYTKRLASSPRKKAKRMREALENGEAKATSALLSDEELALDFERDLLEMQMKCYRMCADSAKALGLSITSRCKLVIPKPAEPARTNRFAQFTKDASCGN